MLNMDNFKYDFNWPFLYDNKCYDVFTSVDRDDTLVVTVMHHGKVVSTLEKKINTDKDDFVRMAFDMAEEAIAIPVALAA